MTDNTSSINKRIARNTMLLYVRMLFIMAVTLYTSRIVLQILGVTDFGIYNVVGGVVSIFAFLNSALGSSTQRYISYALGKGDMNDLKNIFTSSVVIHIIIALVILLLAETLGLWLFYTKLNFPEERINAAFWAFQASVLACIINVVSVPYNSLIIAHERMAAFAYISIVEVLFKLLLVFFIAILPFDKLILYAVFILFSGLIIRIIYQIYCQRQFAESRLSRIYDWTQFKGMLSFSGWTLIGMLAWTCQTQGINILLNMFLGPVINAARAIADQVNNAVMQLINNFQLAAKPQIIKYYANNEIQQMNDLVLNICSLSSYLLILCIIPIIINIDYLLYLWLGKYPIETPVFVQIILFQSLTQAIVTPVIMITQATGEMKIPNIYGGLICLITIPMSYILLMTGIAVNIVLLLSIIPLMLKSIIDVYYANKYVGFSISKFYTKVYLKVILIFLGLYSFMFFLKQSIDYNGVKQFLILSTIGVISTILVIFYIGFTNKQRGIILTLIRNKILMNICKR